MVVRVGFEPLSLSLSLSLSVPKAERCARLQGGQGSIESTGSMVVRVGLERAKLASRDTYPEGGVQWSLVLGGEGAVGEPMVATLVLPHPPP